MTKDMTTTTTAFDRWLRFYDAKFERISNDSLKGYWYLYGRDSDQPATARDMAAWASVNGEMFDRGL
jgi:hypothetical protein